MVQKVRTPYTQIKYINTFQYSIIERIKKPTSIRYLREREREGKRRGEKEGERKRGREGGREGEREGEREIER